MRVVATIIAAIRMLWQWAAVCLPVFRSRKPADSSPFTNRGKPYGWLYHSLCVLALYVGAGALNPARAAGDDYTSAMAKCQAALPDEVTRLVNTGYIIVSSGCYAYPLPGFNTSHVDAEAVTKQKADGPTNHKVLRTWSFNGDVPPPNNPCSSLDPHQMAGGFGGKVLEDMTWCKPGVPDPDSGGTVSCGMSFKPSGPPTRNEWGNWHTPGALTSTGNTCDGDGGGGGHNNWSNPDGTPAADPIPPQPSASPPSPDPPKVCGGLSCYDPGTDNFCATSGGSQVCVGGGPARGDQGGPNAGKPSGSPPGACASGGDVTVCAGSPTAPLPPPPTAPTPNNPNPPTSPISDPSAALRGSDQVTQANPVTGQNQTVTTTVYANPGTPVSSGQEPGDTGPASSSSAPDKPCTSGASCDNKYAPSSCDGDPATAGDPLLSAAVVELHRIRCTQSKKDLDADDLANGDKTTGTEDVHDASSVVSEDDGSGDGDLSNVLDSSGFLGGGRACPGFKPVMYLDVNILDDTGICQTAGLLAGFVLAAAYTLAAIIIYRGKAS